jgi:anti-sigma regulatory factor (Ser/Thr protein kinase)
MPTISVSFSPVTAHVRTARLVALAVARRAGVAEEMLDEVRLAVGEACSRAVGVHVAHETDEPVKMLLLDDRSTFGVEVTDIGNLEDDKDASLDLAEVSARALDDELPDAMPSGFGLAVISGLVENLVVTSDGTSTCVRMVWPAGRPPI